MFNTDFHMDTKIGCTVMREDRGEGEAVLHAFRGWLALRGRSTNTMDSYVGDVGVFMRFAGGRYGEGFDMAMFNRSDLQNFYQQQTLEEKVSPATWNRRRASLRVFAAYAQEAGLLSYDPTDGLPMAESVELAPQWLEGRELGKLERAVERAITAARTPAQRAQAVRNRAVVLVMAKCGLREGEVCGLELGDVVLGERKGKISIRYGKGNKSRVAPANSQVVAALRQWLAMRPTTGPENAVFVGKGGERLQARGIQRLVAELGRQAGVEGLTPHRLRHSCAKALLNSGAQLTEVAKLLGHAGLNTTMRYVLPSDGDLAAAVERI